MYFVGIEQQPEIVADVPPRSDRLVSRLLALARDLDRITLQCRELSQEIESALRLSTGRPEIATHEEQSGQLIIQWVAEHYGMNLAVMRSHQRPERFVRRRWIAARLIREFTPLSDGEIGLLFNRERSSISNALSVLANRLETEADLRREWEDVRRYVKHCLDLSRSANGVAA
jgi:chromosomal replication initiation ATPase DnaA